jgi:hypothetical protein
VVTGAVRCDPVVRGPDVARGPELGRRVRAVCWTGLLHRWPSSEPLLTARCCPWGTVRDRYHGHAEGTAGEDKPGSGGAAMVTT